MTVEEFETLPLPKKRQALREIAGKIDTSRAMQETAFSKIAALRNEIEKL